MPNKKMRNVFETIINRKMEIYYGSGSSLFQNSKI